MYNLFKISLTTLIFTSFYVINLTKLWSEIYLEVNLFDNYIKLLYHRKYIYTIIKLQIRVKSARSPTEICSSETAKW